MTALLDRPEQSPVGARRIRTRADAALLGLIAVHVVLAAVMYARVRQQIPIGDEAYYTDAARALSNLVRDLASFRAPDGHELSQNVVSNGWFMPGTSLLLTPLFLVLPHADVGQWRLYLSVVTTVLFVVALLDVRRVLGRSYAVALAVVPGLMPMWVLFGATAWGDMAAGILLILLLTRLVELMRALRAGRAPTLREGALLGLLAIGALYLRGSTLPLVAALLVGVVAAVVWLLRGQERRRGLAAVLVAAGVFVALLLPWSVSASTALHGRVVTTTSVPLGMGNTFGDSENFCFGPCDPHSMFWFAPVRYSREVARATGVSELVVQRQMATYAMRGVTPHSYSREVARDFHNYLRDPALYAAYLHPPNALHRTELAFIRHTTEWMFDGVLIVGGVVALLLVTRRSYDDQVLSIALKLVIGGLLLQPFVHVSGSRYWPTSAPMAVLALVLAGWQGAAWLRPPGDLRPPSPVLTWVQGVLVAGAATVAAGVAVLSV